MSTPTSLSVLFQPVTLPCPLRYGKRKFCTRSNSFSFNKQEIICFQEVYTRTISFNISELQVQEFDIICSHSADNQHKCD